MAPARAIATIYASSRAMSGCDRHDPPQGLESSLRQALAPTPSFPQVQGIAASLRTL